MFSTIIVCAQNDFIPIDRKYEEKEVTAPLAETFYKKLVGCFNAI
jgi:phenolic acid decarboxylase